MKNYKRPDIKIIAFSVEDVITQSGVIVNAGSLTGANKEMYEVYQQNSATDNTNIAVFTW